MDTYVPRRDLPEDIQELDESERACRYCGVSYLVHHEFKTMKERLAKLEEEVKETNACKERETRLKQELEERETQLRRELEESRARCGSLEAELANRSERLDKCDLQVSAGKHRISEIEDERRSLAKELDEKTSTFNSLKESILVFRKSLNSLRSELAEQKKLNVQLKLQSSSSIKTILSTVDCLMKSAQEQKEHARQLTIKAERSGEEYDAVQLKLSSFLLQVEIVQREKDLTTQAMELVRKENEQLKEERKELSKCPERLSKQEEIVLSLQKMNRDLQDRLNKSKREKDVKQEKMEMCKKAMDDLTKERQAKMELREKYEELKVELDKVLKEKSKLEEKEEKEGERSGELREELRQAQEEKLLLIDERSEMISSHKQQVSDLQDALLRLQMSTKTSNTNLQKALSDEKKRSARDLEDLHNKLVVQHSQVLGNIQAKLEREEKQSQLYAQLLAKERCETIERNVLQKEKTKSWKERLRDLEAQRDAEMMEHIQQVKELSEEKRQLSEKLEKAEQSQVERRSGEEEKRRLSREFLTKEEKLKSQISTLQEKVSVLEGTVQSECEERFQLLTQLQDANDKMFKFGIQQPGGRDNSLLPMLGGRDRQSGSDMPDENRQMAVRSDTSGSDDRSLSGAAVNNLSKERNGMSSKVGHRVPKPTSHKEAPSTQSTRKRRQRAVSWMSQT